jgi:putative chitinase
MAINRNFFFEQVTRTLFTGKLTAGQRAGLTAIFDEWEANYSTKDDRWLAYMLATVHHETDRTFRGIEEYGKGKTRPYGKKIKMNRQPYVSPDKLYYGRGFVQLTWYENYEAAGKKIGVDLLKNPELALDLKNCTLILIKGMIEGWFTSRKLITYFNGPIEDWRNARRIINGTDKADLIADYAKRYYGAISHIG